VDETEPSHAPSAAVKKGDGPVVEPEAHAEKHASAPLSMASFPAAQALPAFTPVDVTAQPHRTHSNLSVVLHRRTAGTVEVRILDKNGGELLLLYQGPLQPGTWAFDWDGKLGDGRAAAPGKYQIQMLSGGVTQVKNIQIR